MKKIITVFLAIFIVLIFFFIVIRYFANAPRSDNWFNSNFRAKFAHYPFFRSVFNLRWDGDAKTDYLLPDKFTKLKIEIDREDGCQISDKVMRKVEEQINKVIDKPDGINIVRSDVIPLIKDSYSSAQIRDMMKMHQNYFAKNQEAVLYILCANVFEDKPSNIGLTINETGIALFWGAMQQLTANNPAILDSYMISTILHEFGHQLGLDHFNGSRCLMSESIESPGNAGGAIQLVPATYCQEELQAIENIRNSLYNGNIK